LSEFQETELSERPILPKNIDYGYAVTSHKGQGSTYKYIFADLHNMDNPANLRMVKDKGEDFAIERQQLKYVGLSRASVEAFVYTRKTNESILKEGKSIKQAPPTAGVTFEQSFSPERQEEIINNFSSKHNMTKEAALAYIKQGIAQKGQEAINKLNECY
jgi:hypothetical protein